MLILLLLLLLLVDDWWRSCEKVIVDSDELRAVGERRGEGTSQAEAG